MKLSVVIATYNRRESLKRCLEALRRQSPDRAEYEVVVVVDGSQDGTLEMLEESFAADGLTIEAQKNRGSSAARNRGVELASGPYLLFIDDDIIAEADLVKEHLRAHRDSDGLVALGRLTFTAARTDDGFARWLGNWWTTHYSRLESLPGRPTYRDMYSGNLSMSTRAFRAVGGFSLAFRQGDDVELGYRLRRAGLRFVYTPQAAGRQLQTKSFTELASDSESWGEASAAMVRLYPQTLADLPIGGFGEASARALLLRRTLLAIRLSAFALARIDSLLQRLPASDDVYAALNGYFYWRGVRRSVSRSDWHGLTRGTILLMYHAVGGSDERASRFVLPARVLRRQLAWLRRRRYPVLTLDEYVRLRQRSELPPPRTVVLTFDDGYEDTWQLAYPLLREFDVAATVFITSDAAGERELAWHRGRILGRPLLGWDRASEMQRGGVHFGAHGRTHTPLTELTPADAEAEIADSRTGVERSLDTRVRHFSYPFGKTNETVERIVERLGFESAVGIRPGRNSASTPIHALRRVEVSGTASFLRFALAVHYGISTVSRRT